MANGRRSSDRGERLFVSLDPPGRVRREVSLWGREASATIRGSRPVGSDSIHLTLAFLGSVQTADRESVESVISGLRQLSARLQTAGPLLLPRHRPRAVAIEIVDPEDTLAAIRRELLGILNEAIGWRPERSGLLPHMTAVRLGRDAAKPGSDLPPTPALEFDAREVVLYRSILDPSGAIYEPLVRVGRNPSERN